MTATMLGRANDAHLRERASKVIPGGMYGHMNMSQMPNNYPQFMVRGTGSRLWDVDGREYVDLMCGWGPIVLGRQHPAVEAAVSRQLAEGDCLNGPAPIMIELAELMCELIPHADWALFAKNGTDATTACVTTARAATGRRRVLMASGAYHGAIPWCTPRDAGVLPEDRAYIDTFEYNDVQSLRSKVAEHADDLAAIIISPARQELGKMQEFATRDFAQECRSLCDTTGAVLILDDVRCGFRISLGGSWEHLGVRPDLAAWSKAIGNGYALSAITGCDSLRDAASKIYITGSFWYSAVSMAASVATLTTLRETDALDRIRKSGELLRDGLLSQAASHGLHIEYSGPVQMPLLQFRDDAEHETAKAWANACVAGGAYVHPLHNWFLSAAHTPEDIEQILEATNDAFGVVAQ